MSSLCCLIPPLRNMAEFYKSYKKYAIDNIAWDRPGLNMRASFPVHLRTLQTGHADGELLHNLPSIFHN